MKRIVIAVAAAALLLGAAPKGTESKWDVKKGSTTLASVTLLHEDGKARAEWKKDAKASPVVFLSDGAKLWVRESGGDIESKDYKGGAEASILPALIRNADKQAKLTIDGGYTATRTSVANRNIDTAEFTIRPKKGAAQRLARLSGDLFGPSTSGASATAGGRGASGSGLKLKDGGNYDELTKLENRDAEWKSKLDSALTEFQKDGKVGKERSE